MKIASYFLFGEGVKSVAYWCMQRDVLLIYTGLSNSIGNFGSDAFLQVVRSTVYIVLWRILENHLLSFLVSNVLII